MIIKLVKTKYMELDVKKIAPSPKDKWEAIHLLTKAQQDLISAFYIIQSILDNDSECIHESQLKRMKDFTDKFKS